MKTTMNLATSKGFIFRNGKLRAYEFISALIDFENETVEYTCKLGGRKTTFMADECPEVYAGAKEFKAQLTLKKAEIKWSDILCMTFNASIWKSNCDATGEFNLWMIEDNQPVAVPAPKANFLYRDRWDIDYVGKGEYIQSREIALLHCDLIKVDENGVETIEESPARKMKLTEEQLAALDDVKKALERAKEAGVQIVVDTGNCKTKVFSTSHMEKFEVDYDCCGRDGVVDYGDLLQSAPFDIYDANLCDYPLLVTWK